MPEPLQQQSRYYQKQVAVGSQARMGCKASLAGRAGAMEDLVAGLLYSTFLSTLTCEQ
jgi:hypothetical protein